MRAPRRTLLLALAVVLLGGCNLVALTYDRLDSIAAAYADHWFDLDAAQSARLRAAVRARLAEHRRDELPRYAQFLRELRALIATDSTPAEVARQVAAARALYELGIKRTLPLFSDMLAGLTPEQVAHFERAIAADDADRAERSSGSPEERRDRRIHDLTRQLERWTGRLDDRQRALLVRLGSEPPDREGALQARRHARQVALLALLRAHASSEQLQTFMAERWLGESDTAPELAVGLAQDRERWAAGVAELVRSLSAGQRQRAARKLEELAQDIAEAAAER